MTIRVALNHHTSYTFDRPVVAYPHLIRLRPAPHTRTPIRGYSFDVAPAEHFINWQQDPFGNFVARVVFPDLVTNITLDVDVVVDLEPVNPFDFFLEPESERFPFVYPDRLAVELAPYLELVDDGPLFDQLVANIDLSPKPTMDFLVGLNALLRDRVDYSVRLEEGVQTAEQTLQLAIGSCRDSAWLLVQILRRLGLAARFVSGYLVQLVSDPRLAGAQDPLKEDFVDLHAWTEVFLPGAGWVGLDPTSGMLTGEGHIPLAVAPHPTSAAAISGATSPCNVDFSFRNTVKRLVEPPRTTRPYPPAVWERIDRFGSTVDGRLSAADVRLTMGGEPTFVSETDRDDPQWTLEADGAEKRAIADRLTEAMQQRFFAGGMVHFGEGKWYPGEPLPRWSRRLYRRTDGEPIWPVSAPSPFVEPPSSTSDIDPGSPTADSDESVHRAAEQVARQLAGVLGLEASSFAPTYEDPVYHVWQESTVPPDIDPADLDPERADLDEAGHRATLARRLIEGLGRPRAWVLPLGWTGTGWVTCTWSVRRGILLLAPGNSPAGLRLPLGQLPTLEEIESGAGEADPTEPKQSLPAVIAPPKGVRQAGVRTAMCVEARDGHVWVFLPPIEDLEAYLSLVAAIAEVSRSTGTAIRIEGYDPPSDPRLASMSITPDPGVLEVNVEPSASWSESVERTNEVYRLAAEVGLSAERFELDGTPAGTGGGNHITLGSAVPLDSPFLRRPELLASLVNYWQHHPGLSYLFSGLFIGPTSQSPRIDEARDETLDEVEIALGELRRHAADAPPWLGDRVLRNLLVDLTGNTHRAEICIDKLYPPEASGRRLGLVELRGFEMPPHPEMALVQELLIRCLIARFWDQPYAGRLIKWGSRLHDQFMLPHFVAADVREVAADLARFGMPFDPAWLDPFVEFRFPLIGSVEVDGITLTLRRALEPWNVLGEQMTASGTSRAVDSSMERIQVEVKGAISERHVIACNGFALALHPTGTDGTMVGGVRYRAWLPPHALHPTIGVHSPLVFDVIDTWSARSLGGCRYHVSHPGGRSYETAPVNAVEAASRRESRFWEFGHSSQGLTEVATISGREATLTPIGSTPPGGEFDVSALDVSAVAASGYTLDLLRLG